MRKACLVSSYSLSLLNFRGPLIDALLSRGYQVVALGPADESVAAQLKQRNVDFVPIGPRRTSLNPLSDLVYAWRLARAFAAIRPDLVISYTAKPVIWGSIAARMSRVRSVCAMVTGLGSMFEAQSGHRRLLRSILSMLYRAALGACDRVVFQNPDDREEFLRLGLLEKTKALVVHGSGVDVERFAPVPIAEKPICLLIARLIADKGIREYVEAARIVRERHPEAEFRLVGWFDDNPSAISEAEVARWSQAGWVTYRGAVADVRDEIAQCQVYVLPSYREGTPRTVLEAMAMGRPVVTTDVPGCRETVQHDWNGLLVERGDARSLAAAMGALLTDRPKCELMGRRSRELAVSKYEARAVAETVLEGIGA